MPRLGRMTIGLYNSYDPVNFREAHRRILARAGPLSLAFDANLATFGFPFPKELSTPHEIADWTATTTSIGENGRYLRELTSKGRFQVFPFVNKGFPPQLGEVVLTTCNADQNKKRSVGEVCTMLLGGESVCLIFGTGPKGTPKELFEIAQHHFDVTFGAYSLETCTAIGAVVAVLAHELRRARENKDDRSL
ncbi:MAG: DUF531 domain-containing protein [Methanomassiliicoccales archaeon]|nr:DUF531 domain-containing protein [Methanomassiliicoccales archaeon]